MVTIQNQVQIENLGVKNRYQAKISRQMWPRYAQSFFNAWHNSL
jgi:hypothetical protein